MATRSSEPNAKQGNRPRVFVVRRLPEPIEDELRARYDAHLNATDETYPLETLVDAAKHYDAIVPTVVDNVPRAVFSVQGRRTRIIANYGVGSARRNRIAW